MAEARAKLAAAAVAVPDDEMHEFFSDAEWERSARTETRR
jgi:hypothetical protein